MKIKLVNDVVRLPDMCSIHDEALFYKCLIDQDHNIYVNKLVPPKGSYFLDIHIYGEARASISEMTAKLENNKDMALAVNNYLGAGRSDIGFGPLESEEYIEIFTIGDCDLDRYFDSQFKQFTSPCVKESTERSMLNLPEIMNFISSSYLSQKLAEKLRIDELSNLDSVSYKRLMPQILSLSPQEKPLEECLQWIMLIEKINSPTYHDLLVASMAEIDPLTGADVGLNDKFYSRFLNKEVTLKKLILRAEQTLVHHYPVIALDPLVRE